jgi:hypothetical protein
MNKYERIKFLISDYNSEALFLDGFDEAIIGYTNNSSGNAVCVYNIYKIYEILIKESSLTSHEAFEYFDFNIKQAYLGEHQPVYVDYLIDAI